MNRVIKLLTLPILLFSSTLCYAWTHGVSIGYAFPNQEVGYQYTQSGFFMNGKLYRFANIDPMFIITIDGSLGIWHASTANNNSLTTLGISTAFRTYFFPPDNRQWTPYLLASFGPNYLSNEHFGEQVQGAHLSFQTTLGAGMEIQTIKQHAIDINLRLVHYCNAGIFKPNEGFDFFYTLSVGYLF